MDAVAGGSRTGPSPPPPDPSSHAADVSGLLLVRYEARLRSLEWQAADLKDEVRRLRG